VCQSQKALYNEDGSIRIQDFIEERGAGTINPQLNNFLNEENTRNSPQSIQSPLQMRRKVRT
jgi:hypothetical protein